jgi:hypothetical protein
MRRSDYLIQFSSRLAVAMSPFSSQRPRKLCTLEITGPIPGTDRLVSTAPLLSDGH